MVILHIAWLVFIITARGLAAKRKFCRETQRFGNTAGKAKFLLTFPRKPV